MIGLAFFGSGRVDRGDPQEARDTTGSTPPTRRRQARQGREITTGERNKNQASNTSNPDFTSCNHTHLSTGNPKEFFTPAYAEYPTRMADVRNLLRNERASRRITHPHASYSKSGQLLCGVCQLFIKSETLWDGHLRSANHKKNVQKAQNGGATLEPVSKKRKLDDDEEDTRKKSKGDYEVGGRHEEVNNPIQAEASSDIEATTTVQNSLDSATNEKPSPSNAQADLPLLPSTLPSAPPNTAGAVDEDEWAAFEREVVPLTQEPVATSEQYGSATISAAPMTAAEIAAQQQESTRPRREEELEDEQEDEGRRMEEEFEVMEEMEDRVKKLKERREALRTKPQVDEGAERLHAEVAQEAPGADGRLDDVGMQVRNEQVSDENSEDDASDFDDWALR